MIEDGSGFAIGLIVANLLLIGAILWAKIIKFPSRKTIEYKDIVEVYILEIECCEKIAKRSIRTLRVSKRGNCYAHRMSMLMLLNELTELTDKEEAMRNYRHFAVGMNANGSTIKRIYKPADT